MCVNALARRRHRAVNAVHDASFDSGVPALQRHVNVLRLFTFGGLGLEFDDGSPAPRLRRPPLAMLAVLASAGERGVSRERLASLFWPESDEEHARHSARQVLYALRQELGADVVRSIGSTLSLDPAAITTDVAEFRAAIATGDRERAVGLVRGPFLDAFYLPGASEFERWMEEERGRLSAATTSALVALATEATRLQRLDAAVEWWRQLTMVDPLSGRFAVGYLKALAARGDRAEALAFARQHELVMRRELEADPDPDVRRLEAELRAMPSPRDAVPNGSGNGHPVLPDAQEAPRSSASSVPTDAPAPGVAAPQARWGQRRIIAVVGAAAMLLLIVTAAYARQRGWLRAGDAPPTFAVGLIREEGADSVQIGRVLTDMMATNLARIEGLRVLANSRVLELIRPGGDPAAGFSDAARRAGATALLEGNLLPDAAGGFALEIRHVDLRTGIVRDVFRARASDRYALVDSVTRLIAAQLRLSSPAGSVADATTTSLVAYRFYEEGLRAFYQGDLHAAQRLMRAALVEDSTYAMAAWFEALLAGPSGVTPDGRHVTEARRTALRLAQRAPDRERLTITANVLGDNNEPSVVAVAESLTTRYPDDPRALIILGKVRASAGDWAGAVASTERAIALDSMAETSGSSPCRLCEDFYHLTEIYFWWDSLPASQRTARRFLALRPGFGQPLAALALSAARLGDSTSAYASFRRLASMGPVSPYFKLALDLTLEDYDVVERDVRPLLASSSMVDWGNGAWTYFIALRNQGRIREATQFSNTGWFPGLPTLRVERQSNAYHQAIVALESGDPRAAARWFQRITPNADSAHWARGVVARNRTWGGTLTGMALAAAGDTLAVRVLADSVERWGRASGYGRDPRAHHYLRGLLHAAAGRHEQAVVEFRAAIHSPSLGFTRINYELAKSLLRLDRPRDAVAALQPALRGAVDASNMYISRTELHELLAESFERAGERDSAAVHYEAVVRAWRRADPKYHARREQAAAWLARRTGPVRTARR